MRLISRDGESLSLDGESNDAPTVDRARDTLSTPDADSKLRR